MSDETENLNNDPASAGESTPPSSPTPQEGATTPASEEKDGMGKSLRDAIAKPSTATQEETKETHVLPNFNVATEEEVKQYIDNLPKIEKEEIYKDLQIGEDFKDLPKVLMDAKIPPQQMKPLLDFWNNRLEEIYAEQTSEDDYQEKLHKYMGADFDKYQEITDQQLIKYVPNELRESMRTASNDLMVAAKTVIAGTIKEYEGLIEQIKKDYGVDPSKYKIGSLQSATRNIEDERAALTKEIFQLKLKGDNAGVEKKAAELRHLMGFKE